jgi:hypothetical protein
MRGTILMNLKMGLWASLDRVLGFRVQGLGFRRQDERDNPNEFEDGTLGIVR